MSLDADQRSGHNLDVSAAEAESDSEVDLGRPVDQVKARLSHAARWLGPAVLLYTAVKLVGFLAFMWFYHYGTHQSGFLNELGSWDGIWYRQIAQYGYHPVKLPADLGLVPTPVQNPNPPNLVLTNNAVAFFPLYPMVIRLVMACTALGGYGGGLLASILCSFAAAAGIYALAERLIGRRAALITCALWAVAPGSGAEWAVYTESLFTALAMWGLYCILTRRWVAASCICFAAGLSRPTAFALIAALGLSALWAMYKRQDGWRPYTALASPLGMIGYVLWAGHGLGSVTGYFTLEKYSWGHYFDFGKYTVRGYLNTAVGRGPDVPALSAFSVGDTFSLVVLTALPVLLILMLRLKLPMPVVVFTLLTVYAGLSSVQLFSNDPRYLLPAVPLLFPLASALRRLSWRSLAPSLLFIAAASGWYAGFVMFILGVP